MSVLSKQSKIQWIGPALFLFLYPTTALSKIEVNSSTVEVERPLSTEKLWELHPKEGNPHRSRWAVERKLSASELEVVAIEHPKRKSAFGVKLARIDSWAGIYVRPEGPWYRPLQEFPCSERRQDWFASQEGSLDTARRAAALWDAMLKSEVKFLESLLQKVAVPNRRLALWLGNEIFHIWERDLRSNWFFRASSELGAGEWAFYQKQAKAQKVCSGKKQAARVDWHQMMEGAPALAISPQSQDYLVRAPARRWDGRFTVRLQMEVAGKTVVGQFLIDSLSPHSLLSPQWLDSQGINKAFIKYLSRASQEISWGGKTIQARAIRVKDLSLSRLKLNANEFLLADTSLFVPPRHPQFCCDGVLGTDFLRTVVAEFETGLPSRLRLWQPSQFWRSDLKWIEAHIDQKGRVVSSCQLVPVNRSGQESKGAGRSVQINWSSSLGGGVQVASSTRKITGAFNLRCSGQLVGARQMSKYRESLNSEGFGESLVLGSDFFFAQSIVLDLPHGRIWLMDSPVVPEVRNNLSGITLKYDLSRSFVRSVSIASIKKGSPAAELQSLGLKSDSELVLLAGESVKKLGAWDLERILAGERGKEIAIAWRDPQPAQQGKKKTKAKARPLYKATLKLKNAL